jgi:hypothetical protein
MDESRKDQNWSNIRKKLFALKGLALIGSADIIGNAVSSIFWLVVASLLLVEEYGEISYFIAIASLGICCVVGSPETLMVFSTKHQNFCRGSFINCFCHSSKIRNNFSYFFIYSS